MGSRLFHRKAGVVHVVDEKIEVHLLFSMLPGPRRRSEASHSMEREAADRLPAQSQPVRISLRLGQVEDLLPEPGQSLGVVALQDELGQLAYGHLSNVRASRHPQALIDQQADPVRLHRRQFTVDGARPAAVSAYAAAAHTRSCAPWASRLPTPIAHDSFSLEKADASAIPVLRTDMIGESPR